MCLQRRHWAGAQAGRILMLPPWPWAGRPAVADADAFGGGINVPARRKQTHTSVSENQETECPTLQPKKNGELSGMQEQRVPKESNALGPSRRRSLGVASRPYGKSSVCSSVRPPSSPPATWGSDHLGADQERSLKYSSTAKRGGNGKNSARWIFLGART
jgi:hypothetical protein